MQSDRDAPPELRARAQVLLQVMAGVEQPDLSGLQDELASAVRGLLGRLRNAAAAEDDAE